MRKVCVAVLVSLCLSWGLPPAYAQTRWELIGPIRGDTVAGLPTAGTAGKVRRLTDGGAVGGLVVDDGTSWNCEAAKSQEISIVTCPPFNAKGDGVTNDAAAIIAANAAGARTVYFPPGTYMLGSQVMMSSNRRYIGAGTGATMVKLLPNTVGAAFNALAPLSNVEIGHMTIDGNRLNNPQASVALIGIGASAQTGSVNDIRYHDLVIQNSTEYCIGFEGGVHTNIYLTNLTIDGCDRDGIDIKAVTDGNDAIYMDNIHVSNFGLGLAEQAGIEIRGHAHLSNIRIDNVKGDDSGIRFNREDPVIGMTGSSGSTLTGFNIRGTSLVGENTEGLRIRSEAISISNGYIRGVNRGVYIESPYLMVGTLLTNITVEATKDYAFTSQGSNDKGTGMVNCAATNNLGHGFHIVGDQARLVGSQSANNGGRGIWLSSASVDPIVMGNYASGNGTNFLNDSLTAHVNDNVGIRTRTSGPKQVNQGATTAVVDHNLISIPLIQDISITPANSPTNDIVKYWVSNVTATQFTINVGADPGVSAALFSWQAATLK